MFHAVLMAPDGDFVTDFEHDSIEQVWNCVNDMGSKWIFYPYVVVVEYDTTIVDGGEEFPGIAGASIWDLQEFVRELNS